MKSVLLLFVCSLFVFSATESRGQDAPKRNVTYENLQVGQWYNFYFLKGRSPFTRASAENKHAKTSLTIHAAKIVSKKSKSDVTITFPKRMDDHLAILSARAKDEKEAGAATVEGPHFKRWEREITEWKTIPIDLKNVKRISRMP